MPSDVSARDSVAHQAEQVERDAQALLAVFLQALSGVEGRVSAAQLRALAVLRERGPLNLGDLAAALGVRPSSATRLCDRLTAGGLLLREVAPHSRREVVLSLSRPGRDLLVELEQYRRDRIRSALAGLDDEERQALVTGLAAFAAADAGRAAGPPGPEGALPRPGLT